MLNNTASGNRMLLQWSPSSKGGSTLAGRGDAAGHVVAAMEPADEQREHRSGSGASWRSGSSRNGALRSDVRGAIGTTRQYIFQPWPQWSPPLDGGTMKTTWWGTGMEQQPQWSPPRRGGSTGLVNRPGEVERLAAMEPAVEGREHPVYRGAGHPAGRPAAMEPAVEGRERSSQGMRRLSCADRASCER